MGHGGWRPRGRARRATTGVLHTRFGINKLLAGILTTTALYSINLHVMGKSNLPLLSGRSLPKLGESAGRWLAHGNVIHVFGWDIGLRDSTSLFFSFLSACVVGGGLYWFFRTNLGSAMRATGDNAQMIRALGVSVENMIVLGLASSNGLVGLRRRAACAVPGLRRRADGNRHGGLGPGQRHHRRSAHRL